MNCKPGDIARVVPPVGDQHFEFNYGKLVEVVAGVQEQQFWSGRTDWECIALGDLKGGDGQIYPRGSAVGCLDAELRPIRDPGDGAVDESKAWLPSVPSQHKEVA